MKKIVMFCLLLIGILSCGPTRPEVGTRRVVHFKNEIGQQYWIVQQYEILYADPYSDFVDKDWKDISERFSHPDSAAQRIVWLKIKEDSQKKAEFRVVESDQSKIAR